MLIRFAALVVASKLCASFPTRLPPPSKDAYAETSATEHFFADAALDHFDAVSPPPSPPWKQRFWTDDTWWCGDGCPIFLLIGNEAPASPIVPYVNLYVLAQQHGALMVVLEHRFYGESQPTADLSTRNMRYLTSEQALGDVARYLQYLLAFDPSAPDAKSSPPLALRAKTSASKVVAFGYSYGGTLAAWARLKYPTLIAGSIASSSPVHAQFEFSQYMQVVEAALSNPKVGGSVTCAAALSEGAVALHALVTSTTPPGASPAIPDALRPCTPMASPDDLAQYEDAIAYALEVAVQMNGYGESLAAVCNGTASVTPLDALAAAFATAVNPAMLPGPRICVPSSWEGDMMAPLKNTTADATDTAWDTRQWKWQKCNEFGWFHSTTGAGSALAAFTALTATQLGPRICAEAFGLPNSTEPNTQRTNTMYGDRSIQATNVVFVHGSMDPWHALGLVNATDPFYQSCAGSGACPAQSSSTSGRKVVFVEGTGHVQDWWAPGENVNVREELRFPLWAYAEIAASVASFVNASGP
jgi:thymus-specific serine protease